MVCFIPRVQDPHLEMVVRQEAVGVDDKGKMPSAMENPAVDTKYIRAYRLFLVRKHPRASIRIGLSMSAMPNAGRADISETKVLGHLLNAAHPDGASKAAFFTAMGYRKADWRVLRQSLAAIAQTGRICAIAATRHGVKYIIDGVVEVPRGGSAAIRTIWITDGDYDVPRLVTAYPAEERNDERA
jgi:hypothetical protein